MHHSLRIIHNRGVVWAYRKWTTSGRYLIWDESKGKMRPRKHQKSKERLNSNKRCSSEPHSQLCCGIINEQNKKTSDRKEKCDCWGRYEELHIRLLAASEACWYVCNCCTGAFMRSARENIQATTNIHMLNTCSLKYAIFVGVLLVLGWFVKWQMANYALDWNPDWVFLFCEISEEQAPDPATIGMSLFSLFARFICIS